MSDISSNVMTGALLQALNRHETLTIAVSGGVDSMTLAYFAHRFAPGRITMAHAVSPAVPASAVQRLQTFAAEHRWHLELIDAEELSNPFYRSNPVDRCYFCKQSLYTRIRTLTDGPIASGTNLDDLGDFRPGLKAAKENGVFHPFVEAKIDKPGVRALARHYGLQEIAELPSQPCLASRIETGITIDPDDLAFIERVENELAEILNGHRSKDGIIDRSQLALRCRVTHQGVVVEASEFDGAARHAMELAARQACENTGRTFLGLRPYRRGSAFLTSESTAMPRHGTRLEDRLP